MGFGVGTYEFIDKLQEAYRAWKRMGSHALLFQVAFQVSSRITFGSLLSSASIWKRRFGRTGLVCGPAKELKQKRRKLLGEILETPDQRK